MSIMKTLVEQSIRHILSEKVDLASHYSETKRPEAITHGSTLAPGVNAVGGGAVKSKNGKIELSIFHHKNGHTYIHDHNSKNWYKSSKAEHHTSKQIRDAYADAMGEEPSAYKAI